MADLKLQVLLNLLDKATAPLRKIDAASKASGDSLRKTRDALRALDAVQKQVGEFRKLKEGTRATALRLRELQQQIRATASQMKSGLGPAGEFSAKLKRLTDEARKLKGEESAQIAKLQQLRGQLAASGIATGKLAGGEAKLRGDIASTTASMDKQTAALRAQGEQMRRVQAARDKLGKGQATAAHMSVAGYAAMYGGKRVLGAVAPGLREAGEWAAETQRFSTLGLGDEATARAQKYVLGMKNDGTSVTEKLELIRDATAIFGNEHHAELSMPLLADMAYANKALYGEENGKEQTRRYQDMLKAVDLRGGAKDEATFNLEANHVQKVLNATGGRVQADEWKAMINRGGVAAKLLDRDAFYFGMEPLIQEMGGASVGSGLMSMYQNLYQGKTTVRAAREMMRLGILDKDKVEYDKIGQIKQIRPGALAGGDLFTSDPQKWLESVLLPAMAAQGITSEKDVLSELSTIITNRRGSALMGAMFKQKEQITRSRKLNAGADDIETMKRKADETPQGQMQKLHSAMKDMFRELGLLVLPTYISAVKKLTTLFRSITQWAKDHPALAKWMTLIGAGIGVLAVVAGGAMIALGGLIGQLVLLRYVAGRGALGGRGLMSGAWRGTKAAARGGAWTLRMAVAGGKWLSHGTLKLITGLARGAAFLGRILGSTLVKGIRLVGQVFVWLGRAMLTNPIFLVIALIAGAAYLIWKHWDKIKPYWDALWSGIQRVAAAVWEWLKTAVVKVVEFYKNAWGAIGDFFVALWEACKAPFVAGFKWIGDMLDKAEARWKQIKEAFSNSEAGQTLAIAGDSAQPTGQRWKAAANFAALTTTFAMAPGLDAPKLFDMGSPKITQTAPLMAGGGQSNTVNLGGITIVQRPGESSEDLAKRMREEISAHERKGAAQRRSAFSDFE